MLQTKWFQIGLPLAVLALIGTAIGVQRHELGELESGNEALRERIARVAERANAPAEAAAGARANGASASTGKIDWRKIASWMARGGQGDPAAMRAMIGLQQALLEMSPQELLAQLEEIGSLDLPAKAKWELEDAILEVLGRREPELALDRFAGRLGSGRVGDNWRLARVFQQWVAADASAAAAWMDRQTAAGTFDSKSLDGKNESRRNFEAALLPRLLALDPASARARVAAMSEPLKSDVLKQDLFSHLKPGDEKAMADLIRSGMEEGKAAGALANSSAFLAFKGYENVGQFLTSIDADTEERNAIVTKAVAMKMMNQEWMKNDPAVALDAAREWAGQQAPAVVGAITGDSLGRLGRQDFDTAAKLAVQYHESSGDDAVLVRFLETGGIARGHRELALPLIDRIVDPEKREELRKSFDPKK